jgi:tetratricopeptide (TPR) repeat protein
MIDPRILQALEHSDPTLRKKAVAALGKSHSNEALSILAKVYWNDPDSEVKELARKAGVYLRKQLDENATNERPPSEPTRASDSLSAEAMIAAAHANKQAEAIAKQEQDKASKRKENPLYMKVIEADLEQLRLTATQKAKAKIALEQAMDYSMKKEHVLANEELRKAFDINPALREDSYARSLVLQIVGGRDEDEALEIVLKETPLAQQKATGSSAKGGGNIFGVFQLIAGVMMLAGFFLPWIDFNPYQLQLDPTAITPSMKYSGLDIATNKENVAYMFNVFDAVIDLNQSGELDVSLSRDIKTYSPFLLLAGGGISTLLGLIGMIGGTRRGFGLQGIFSAIVGSGGLIWLYSTLSNFTGQFAQDPNIPFTQTELLEIGFYVGAGGVALAVIIGLVIFIRG